jgi:hypothetical protein
MNLFERPTAQAAMSGLIPNFFKVYDRLGAKEERGHLLTLPGRDEPIVDFGPNTAKVPNVS